MTGGPPQEPLDSAIRRARARFPSTPKPPDRPAGDLPLTGPFDTGKLPKIAGDPVTVTVARRVQPGWEGQFLAWADELVATVRQAPGCLGAAVFHPGPDGGEYQIVVRFVNGLSLREWERSAVRNELMAKADPFVMAARMQRTVGVDAWFEAAGNAQPHRPWWRKLLVDVAWVFPFSFLVSLFIAPQFGTLALPFRVLIGAALITIAVQLVIIPLRRAIRQRTRL